ncbi:unnamed protein product [Allacma fusca]|uniref:Uncharacterized protein n=1 Tax=Allacma fusca TaxID=39272 RepID=A0A8J2MBF6_9HEXA|nr:unnamed protein product [Allacma fusca]
MELRIGRSFYFSILSFSICILAESLNTANRGQSRRTIRKRAAYIDYHKTNDYLNGVSPQKGFYGKGRNAAPVPPGPVPFLSFPDESNGTVPPDPDLGDSGGGGPPPPPSLAPIPPCEPDNNSPPPPLEIGESASARIATQDRYLQILAHKVAIFGVPEDFSQEPNNSFTLYRKTVGIFKHYCPAKVIPVSFIDNVAQTFELLSQYLSPTRAPFTSEEEGKWISLFLDNCSKAASLSGNFVLGEDCSDEILGDSERNPICEPGREQTDPKSFDPMIDIVWRIFELAHTVCFEHFIGFSRIWHRYTAAIEDLFTLPIKQRWSNPVSGEEFFKRLLGPNYRTYSSNIGKCVQYYAAKSKIGVRLHRFNQPFTIRYGHNISGIYESISPPTRPPRPTTTTKPARKK